MVLKTELQDGVVMVIRDFYRAKYLLLLFEPYRVVVQVEDGSCFEEVYHLVDHHLGEWFLVKIDYDRRSSVGLEVNGGPKKTMVSSGSVSYVSCEDNIMIGDVAHMLIKEVNRSNVGKHTSFLRGMQGKLAYLSIDGVEIDLSKLPVESRIQFEQLSSEAASVSKDYFEHRLEMGKPLELGCLYYFDESKRKIFAQVNWNYSVPVWLYSTTPIVHNKLMPWGVKYTIEDKKYLTILSSREYTKESIEGFYSCWLPWNAKSRPSAILVTYGVTVAVCGKLLAGSHSVAVKMLMVVLLVILVAAAVVVVFGWFCGFSGGKTKASDPSSKSTENWRHALDHSPELCNNFGSANNPSQKKDKSTELPPEGRAKKNRQRSKKSFGKRSHSPSSKCNCSCTSSTIQLE